MQTPQIIIEASEVGRRLKPKVYKLMCHTVCSFVYSREFLCCRVTTNEAHQCSHADALRSFFLLLRLLDWQLCEIEYDFDDESAIMTFIQALCSVSHPCNTGLCHGVSASQRT